MSLGGNAAITARDFEITWNHLNMRFCVQLFRGDPRTITLRNMLPLFLFVRLLFWLRYIYIYICSQLKRPFSPSMSEIPLLLQRSQFPPFCLSLWKIKAFRMRQQRERTNKHTMLTWLRAVSCGADFIYRKLQNKIITQRDFCSHQSLRQILIVSFPFPFS